MAEEKKSKVLLEAKDVSEVFGGLKAVSDFNFYINKGELVADTLTKDLHLLAEKVGLKTAADLDALSMEQLFHRLTQE